jgi:hypothetical protein
MAKLKLSKVFLEHVLAADSGHDFDTRPCALMSSYLIIGWPIHTIGIVAGLVTTSSLNTRD